MVKKITQRIGDVMQRSGLVGTEPILAAMTVLTAAIIASIAIFSLF